MLNVQQVRLRFISARLLTSVPSISKGLRKGASTVPLFSKALAGGYPFRCCAQINPQRIKDTPAVNLCSRLVSTPPIFKRLTAKIVTLPAAMEGGNARKNVFKRKNLQPKNKQRYSFLVVHCESFVH